MKQKTFEYFFFYFRKHLYDRNNIFKRNGKGASTAYGVGDIIVIDRNEERKNRKELIYILMMYFILNLCAKFSLKSQP